MPESRDLSRRAFLRGSAAGALAAPAALGGLAAVPAVGAAVTGGASTAADASAPVGLARVWGADALGWLDTTHVVHGDGSVEVLLWPGDLARIEAAGLRVEMLTDRLVARRELFGAGARPAGLPLQPGESPSGDYRTLEEFETELRALAERHPDRARLLELPFLTFEGRRVLGLEIAADVHALDGRPTFHVDGVHHAREWPAGELALMFAYDLLEGDDVDGAVAALLERVRVTVVPIVNPDGFVHSRSAPAETPGGNEAIVLGGRQAYWRKNRRSFTDGTVGEGLGLAEGAQDGAGTGLDAYGVDPNRNYAFTWGRPGSSSADVHSQSHRGDEPFSEPESRNIAWLASTRHVTGAISHHTFAGEIIWPWATEMGEAPDAALFLALGQQAGERAGYRARKYNTSEGTTPDHLYGSTSTLAFLYEHGEEEFHPPYAQDVPARYARTRSSYLHLARETAALPHNHAVVTGRVVDAAGAPVLATLTTRRRHHNLLWLLGDGTAPRGRTSHEEVFEAVAATRADGSFELHLNPSTQPSVLLEGGTQAWELTVLTEDGRGSARRLVVTRGDTIDLGDLPVA